MKSGRRVNIILNSGWFVMNDLCMDIKINRGCRLCIVDYLILYWFENKRNY